QCLDAVDGHHHYEGGVMPPRTSHVLPGGCRPCHVKGEPRVVRRLSPHAFTNGGLSPNKHQPPGHHPAARLEPGEVDPIRNRSPLIIAPIPFDRMRSGGQCSEEYPPYVPPGHVVDRQSHG